MALQKVRLVRLVWMKISQTIINRRSERDHKLRTGFAVHESVIHMIKEFNNVSPRISTLTLKYNDLHIVLINVHVQMENKNEEEK